MNERGYTKLVRLSARLCMAALIVYLLFANTLPFGAYAEFASDGGSVSPLTPAARVETVSIDGADVTRQKDDLVYFTTAFPYRFDTAEVTMTFKNPTTTQQIELGYKDKVQWHYDTQIVDHPLFHQKNFTATGTDPLLYTRTENKTKPRFTSADEFLAHPPLDATIGTLDFTVRPPKPTALVGYSPSTTTTRINVPLRGKHIMYAYLDNEPFRLKIKKKDLNWYEDPDVLDVTIYKDETPVLTATFDDDGITDASKREGPEIVAELNNPGPELPESGVYKIVFDGTGDTVITGIETNLHKIVFEGPVFPIANATVYPNIGITSASTTLFTTAQTLTAMTFHNQALQKISVGKRSIALTTPNLQKTVTLTGGINELRLPQSDAIIGGEGYFAFSKDQLFEPSELRIVPVSDAEDLALVDYVVTPYSSPVASGTDYVTVKRTFDVRDAVSDKGRLSWIIRAPRLKETGGEVIIKSVEVKYGKVGWYKDK